MRRCAGAALAALLLTGCGGGGTATGTTARAPAPAPPAVADPVAAVRDAVAAAARSGRTDQLDAVVQVRGADRLGAAARRRLDVLLPPERRGSERVDRDGGLVLTTTLPRVQRVAVIGAAVTVAIGAGAPPRRASASVAARVRAQVAAGRAALAALPAAGLRVASSRGGSVRLRVLPAPAALVATVLPDASAANALAADASSLEVTLRDGLLTGWRVALTGQVDLGRLAGRAAPSPAAVGAVLSVTEMPLS